jgi:hypothetical protein
MSHQRSVYRRPMCGGHALNIKLCRKADHFRPTLWNNWRLSAKGKPILATNNVVATSPVSRKKNPTYPSSCQFTFTHIHHCDRLSETLFMDRPNLHDSLFARGTSTPPPTLKQHFGPKSSSPQSHIDTLFHNMSVPSSGQQIPTTGSGNLYANPALATSNNAVNNAGISSSSSSAQVNPTADRQSALLSLLGSVPTSGANVRGAGGGAPPPQPQPQPQQIPTPPGSSQRTGNSPSNASETQGKQLLEQLMSG